MLMENYDFIFVHTQIPVALRSKARMFPVIVVSNITGGMDVYYEY